MFNLPNECSGANRELANAFGLMVATHRSQLVLFGLQLRPGPKGSLMIALVGNPRSINELGNRPTLPKGPPGESA
jgi:hypothetical protein